MAVTSTLPPTIQPPASEPYLVRPGVFGATFYQGNEPLFLRMELITERNEANWARYKEMSMWLANRNTGGLLGRLVDLADTTECPSYAQMQEPTGFNEVEYNIFKEQAILQKLKTKGKIVTLLEGNSAGFGAFYDGYDKDNLRYVVYITKNSQHDIQNVKPGSRTLKNYIESYEDILISMGSNFSYEELEFENRGIARNPYWVLKDKYAGFSMLLHGFTSMVAARFFPQKQSMVAHPLMSMLRIMTKNLLPNEGYVEEGGKRTDLTSLDLSKRTSNAQNYNKHVIAVSALQRIYRTSIASIRNTGVCFYKAHRDGCAYPL